MLSGICVERHWYLSSVCFQVTRVREERRSKLCTTTPQLKYSIFLAGLADQNIKLDRKVLSEIAMYEPHSFKALVDQVKFMKGMPL